MLSSSGTLEEVGGPREEGLWGQDVLPLSSGKTQTPVATLTSVPVETVCPELGGFDCGTRPKVYRWELGGPGSPPAAQALGPSEAKLGP